MGHIYIYSALGKQRGNDKPKIRLTMAGRNGPQATNKINLKEWLKIAWDFKTSSQQTKSNWASK